MRIRTLSALYGVQYAQEYGVQHYMSNKCATINRLHCWVQNGQYVDHGEWFLFATAAAGHIEVLEIL